MPQSCGVFFLTKLPERVSAQKHSPECQALTCGWLSGALAGPLVVRGFRLAALSTSSLHMCHLKHHNMEPDSSPCHHAVAGACSHPSLCACWHIDGKRCMALHPPAVPLLHTVRNKSSDAPEGAMHQISGVC